MRLFWNYCCPEKNKNQKKQSKGLDNQVADFIYLGVPASPSALGYKSAAGSRVVAMLQKELPPVAFLQQRPHRLPSLRAFRLRPHPEGMAKPWHLGDNAENFHNLTNLSV